ncbi:MAG: GNAT family N-acetyltransferase [Cognatishimia sp.]|jgi:ribosomal protein S18 acetylase RimI-like enzyme|uniref:GNAT family N-acetyltransferase n=1 Tax=Amaricoccus sp. B4 TaxID=3368557 RepID=UPI000DAB6A1E|tara:strand:- start:417 stop:971 length:555 start_codon:yes stop_codon:yes gene_type:complete
MTEQKYKITQFEKALHDRSAFSCGVPPIDNWIKTSISDETKNDRVRLWCGTDPDGTLFGAYALNPHSVVPEEAGPLARRKDRKPIPVLYLTCLAIDVRFQKMGLGEALMGHAIEKAAQLSKEIPISAIVLDVFEDENFDRRLAFYARLGFSSFDPNKPARMYLTIADARVALAAQEKQKEKATP